MTTHADLLRTTRDLLADPERWTQGELARDAAGNPTHVHGDDAVAFCLTGGVVRAAGADVDGTDVVFELAIEALRSATFVRRRDRSLPDFNDDAIHDQVLAVLDEAIASAGGPPASSKEPSVA